MNVQSILEDHNLNFRIEKVPLIGLDAAGKHIVSPYYGLLNTKSGEIINTTKAGYTVSQNEDVVKMVLDGMKRFGSQLTVAKAGSLHGGRRVYLQMEIEGKGKAGNDNVTRYVTVIDSNDGSTGLAIGIGDKFMHCENQFFKFYKLADARFRHTSTIEQKIQSIPYLIGIALGKSLEQVKIYNKFASTPLTKALANKMVNAVLGYDKSLSKDELAKMTGRSTDMMERLYADIDTECLFMGNNLLGLFNGATRYTTHHSAGPKRDNGHIESMLTGGNYEKNTAAFEFCLANI